MSSAQNWRMRLSSLLLALAASLAQAQGTLIVNANVIDGTGAPARKAEVRIVDGRIYSIGHWPHDPRDRVIDAHGLTLAPGFIDTHSHHDYGLFDHRDALAVVSQGVTTIVAGQDGDSHLPLRDWFARLDTEPAAINVASYVGHGTLRSRVMGDDFKRVATEVEVSRMQALLREDMEGGALGLSTGLEYDPGIYSASSEVLTLAKTVAPYGGRYISHIRSEDRHFWDALNELLTIGREARIPVQVSHMKLGMRGLWGEGDSLVHVLDRARASGVNVTADVYPYTMWHSTLTVLYPERNFTDSAETAFIFRQVAAPEDLFIGHFTPNPAYGGKTVKEIAALRNEDPNSTLRWLIAETHASGEGEDVVATGMDERDVTRLLQWPNANVCSDGELDGAHPRGYGAFTRVLGRYVREQHALTLVAAVHKMTGLAAEHVGITDRGVIRPGMAADLVLFDPATVGDRATIREPHAVSVGINTVWVNGDVVWDNGKTTGTHPGHVLRRASGPTTGEARPATRDPGPVTAFPQATIDSFVRAEMDRERVPGVAVAIIRNGRVLSQRGYGFANVEHLAPVTDETIFQSGSLGKMFTSALVMLLVEDGKLSLSDTIAKFFPDAPATWRSITVRNLLTHTSGIPDSYGADYDFRKDYTETELAHMAYATPLEFPTGSRWNYSNTGYQLLGFIIGKVTGRFYGDVLSERIFKPLGMATARIITEADIVPNRAAGYQLVNGELKNQDWVAPKLNTTADGSLYWSLRDLVVWDSAVRRRALLRPESWNQILTPVTLASGKSYPYGFGWALDTRGGAALQQHGGSWQGFRTQLSRFIGDSLDVIVLANLAQANPARFVNGIAAILDPNLAVKTLAPIADREPQVTQHLTRLLASTAAGTLSRDEFAYVRAGFFPEAANYYRVMLKALGAPTQETLLDRQDLGDDRIYTYDVAYGDKVYRATLGLAPDDRVSSFSISPRP
jgi:N-acyl-D-amino-acid deacylase